MGVKELFNKYRVLFIAAVTLLLFFSVKSCVNQQEKILVGINKQLKEEVSSLKKGAELAEFSRVKEKDSITKENIDKDVKISELMKQITEGNSKINSLVAQSEKQKQSFKNKNFNELAKELNFNFGGNNALAKESFIEIKGQLPSQILDNAVDLKAYKGIIVEKDSQLKIKDSIYLLKNTQLISTKTLLTKSEESVDNYKNLSTKQANLNKGLEKENSKLKTKNTLNKIIIPVIAVVGGFVGFQIAN